MKQHIYITRPVPPWLPYALLFIGIFLVAYLWPDLAFADDCERDPFDAEDCLRTASTAPQIAGAAASAGILSSLWGEIRNTLSSIKAGLQSGWKSLSESASETSQKLDKIRSEAGETTGEINRDVNRAWEWFKDMREANAEGIEEAQRQGGYQGGYYQDTTDELNKVTGASAQDIKRHQRNLDIAEGATSGLRWTLAALGAALWAVAAYFAGLVLWPAIPIAALAYYLPDAAGFMQKFMTGRRGK